MSIDAAPRDLLGEAIAGFWELRALAKAAGALSEMNPHGEAVGDIDFVIDNIASRAESLARGLDSAALKGD